MKTPHFALRNGKIVYVPDVPEPDVENLSNSEAHAKYKLDLQSAIASGIEVENQDEVEGKLLVIHEHQNGFKLQSGKLYPLQCRVEIKESLGLYDQLTDTWSNDGCRKQVARVTFEQPERVAGFDYKQRRQETSFSRKGKPEAAGQEQTPKGAKRVEAYETSTQIVVMWTCAPDDNHSCDEMGCGSLDHVKYRFTKQQNP